MTKKKATKRPKYGYTSSTRGGSMRTAHDDNGCVSEISVKGDKCGDEWQLVNHRSKPKWWQFWRWLEVDPYYRW